MVTDYKSLYATPHHFDWVQLKMIRKKSTYDYFFLRPSRRSCNCSELSAQFLKCHVYKFSRILHAFHVYPNIKFSLTKRMLFEFFLAS